MTVVAFWPSVRRYWMAIVVSILSGAIVALAVGSALPKTYEASTVLLLSVPKVTNPNDSSDYVRNRMPTYAALVESEPVLGNAQRLIGLDESTNVIASRVRAKVEDSTVLLRLTAEWNDPKTASDLANAVARSYSDVAPKLDNRQDLLLHVDVIEAAAVPDRPVGLSPTALSLIGSVAGLTLGLLVAFGRNNYHRFARDVIDIAEATGTEHISVLPSSSQSERSTGHRRLPSLRKKWTARFAAAGTSADTYASLYSRLGLASSAERPRIVVVIPTENSKDASLVAYGLGRTCLASGQRCLLVTAGPSSTQEQPIGHPNQLADWSPKQAPVDRFRRVVIPAPAGGVLTVQAAMESISADLEVADVALVAAQPVGQDASTRTFLQIAGDVVLTTPLSGCRMSVLRHAAVLIRETGATITAVVGTLPHAVGRAGLDPAQTGSGQAKPELIGAGS